MQNTVQTDITPRNVTNRNVATFLDTPQKQENDELQK